MLLSPLFMPLCSAVLLQFHLRWSPGGSDGEAETGPPGCRATYGGFNICRMHCIGFHSHTGILSFVWRCLSDWVPHYLHELCHPLISSCAGRCTLRSSLHGNLVVPFARYAIIQTRSFSLVGPATWTGLPIDLRHLPNLPVLNSRTFSRLFFSAWPESGAPLSRSLEGALYKF